MRLCGHELLLSTFRSAKSLAEQCGGKDQLSEAEAEILNYHFQNLEPCKPSKADA